MTAIDLILALNGTPGDFYVAMDVGDGMTYPVRVTEVDVQHRTVFIAP